MKKKKSERLHSSKLRKELVTILPWYLTDEELLEETNARRNKEAKSW